MKPGYVGGVQDTDVMSPEEAPNSASTVLVVDDERMVRASIRHVLGKHGYEVLEADSGAAALEILREREGRVDLVVTDVMMPEMSGTQLIARMSAAEIRLPVIYISGYMVDTTIQKIAGVPDQWMLAKPFAPAMLMSAVQGALAGR